MALNYNKIVMAGRVATAHEVKQTPTGKSVLNFRLAVNRRFSGAENTESDFFSCQAWGNTAEFIGKYFPKGSAIFITGHLQNRSWEKDGVKHSVTEIIVDEANFVESKNEASATVAAAPAKAPAPAPHFEEIKDDADLPF